MGKPTVSFEFFPPKTDKAAEILWDAVPELVKLNPKFMTVTYGAGGTTKNGTINTITEQMKITDTPIGSHLTFLDTPKDELHNYIDDLWKKNIKHIVALRGDAVEGAEKPTDNSTDYFHYTSDFVEGLLVRHPFEISVGTYPEKHPDSKTLEDDIEALRLKFEAGAARALTQFFFDNNVYYDFVEKCTKAGITKPICPGILPIHDFKSMCNFAKRCQTAVPAWLHKKFDSLENKPEDARKIAIDLLVQQSEDLAKNGVSHIHYYTLNKFDITKQAVQAIS